MNSGDTRAVQSMRIALVSDCYVPTKNGVVTSLMQLAMGLRQRGHRVVLLVPGRGAAKRGGPAPGPGGSVIYYFPILPLLPSVELGLGRISAKRVEQIFLKERIELLHTHTEFTAARAAARAAEQLSLPRVHTVHTTYKEYRHYLPLTRMLSDRGLERLWARFLRRYDGIFCPSERSRQFVRRCAPELPVVLLPNGIADMPGISGAERTALRRSLGIAPDETVLLYCGRLAREKRVVQLAEAVLPLLRVRDRTRLLVVGGGPQHKYLRQAAQRAGVEHKVHSPGYLPWEQAQQYFAAADLFVSASLSENHPMSLLEAQRAGLPAVLRRDRATEAVITHACNGFLASSDAELTRFCAKLLEYPQSRADMSAEAVRNGRSYSIEGFAAAAEELYRRFCDSTKRPQGREEQQG